MGFKVLLQRNTSSHDGGEFNVVHCIAARVRDKIFFNGFFCDPANASGKASKCGRIENSFDELVVRRHGLYIYIYIYI